MPLRIALVGCGRISTRHIDAICTLTPHALSDTNANYLNLVGICDTRRDRCVSRLQQIERHGVPPLLLPRIYTSLGTMLQETSPDILVVATPSGLHVEHALLGVQHDCHLLVEKPVALSVDDLERLSSAAKAKNIHLFGVMQNRTHPAILAVKGAIDNGALGKIHMAHLSLLWNRNQAYYQQASWRGTRHLDGGIFLNQGIHYLDLLSYFLGELTLTHIDAARFARDIEFNDSVIATFRTQSGGLGTIAGTVVTEPTTIEASITLLGSRGSVRLGGATCNDITIWESDVPLEYDTTTHHSPSNERMVNRWGSGHTEIYRNVINTLEGTATPIAPPALLRPSHQLAIQLSQLPTRSP